MPIKKWLVLVTAFGFSLSFNTHCPYAATVTPAKTLRALAGRQVWVPICARRGVNGSSAWFDNTNTAVMDQVACYAPAWGTVTAVKLVFSAFDLPQQGEVDRPVTATGTAAVYIPSANLNVAYSTSAAASGTSALSFGATSLGSSAISIGQLVSSTGGGIAANTYVSSVANTFAAGSGNAPTGTTVTLNTGTTASTALGQPFSFSGLFVPVKFGGRRSFLIEPAHDVVSSDPVAVELAPGTMFYVRTSAIMSGAGMQLMDYPGSGSRLTGEFDSRGTTANDQTMNPATLSNTGGGYWCPTAVLALVTVAAGQTVPGAVLVLGDSLATGTGDTADSFGFQGYIQRSLENNIPFITAARGSTTAFALSAHGDGQYALSIDTGITDIFLEDGRNDISSLQVTDTALEATLSQLTQRYNNAGKRTWCFTIPPTTQSNDGWTSLGNQSWTVAVANTGSSVTTAGSTNVVMASVANLAVGQSVSGTGIGPGTAVAGITGSSVGLSVATSVDIPASTKLSFGSQSAASSSSETYRRAYNLKLRQSGSSLGCTGLIDVDIVWADPGGSGKWRVDLGAASVDGVHPATVLHQAAINAGVISSGMFLAQ